MRPLHFSHVQNIVILIRKRSSLLLPTSGPFHHIHSCWQGETSTNSLAPRIVEPFSVTSKNFSPIFHLPDVDHCSNHINPQLQFSNPIACLYKTNKTSSQVILSASRSFLNQPSHHLRAPTAIFPLTIQNSANRGSSIPKRPDFRNDRSPAPRNPGGDRHPNPNWTSLRTPVVHTGTRGHDTGHH